MRVRSCEIQGACHSGEVSDGLGGERSGEEAKEPQARPGSSDPTNCGRPGQGQKIAKLIGGGGGQRGISAAFAAASVHEESTLDHLGRWAFAAGIPPNAFSHPLWPAAWSALKTSPGSLGAPKRAKIAGEVLNRLCDEEEAATKRILQGEEVK